MKPDASIQICVSSGESSNSVPQQAIASMTNVSSKHSKAIVMLATAVILVLDNQGRSHLCYVLLDSGSH